MRPRLSLSPDGLAVVDPSRSVVVRFSRREAEGILGFPVAWERLDWLPEVVHVEVTSRCGLGCPDCYAGASGDGRDMPLRLFSLILGRLKRLPLLNVTLGGGEPTLHGEFDALVRAARSAGFPLAMTTNGLHLEGKDLSAFAQVNVSFHGSLDALDRALSYLESRGTRAGVNFVMKKSDLAFLPEVAEIARKRKAEVLLLSYKPVTGLWREQVPPEEVLAQARRLAAAGIDAAVDGMSCAGTLEDWCLKGRRFCDVDVDGNLLLCSFLREPVGSLAGRSFEEVWRSRPRGLPCPYCRGV